METHKLTVSALKKHQEMRALAVEALQNWIDSYETFYEEPEWLLEHTLINSPVDTKNWSKENWQQYREEQRQLFAEMISYLSRDAEY